MPNTVNVKVSDARIRSRKLWDKHGAILILAVVAILSANGGAEYDAWKSRQVIEMIVEAGKIERDDLRGRIRELHDRNNALAKQLGPAVESAESATRKSLEAVDKADETLFKAKQIIEGNK